VDVSIIVDPPPTGVNVVVYPVIWAPPFDAGADMVIVAAVEEVANAVEIDGAVGGAAGVVIVEAAVVVAPSPTAFVAKTAIEYWVPADNPGKLMALAIWAALTVSRIGVPPPVGVAMISYSIIVDPPVTVAAPTLMVAEVAVAAEAVIDAGAPGTVAGVTGDEATEAAEEPIALVAVTL
jgi:hypothetical protein